MAPTCNPSTGRQRHEIPRAPSSQLGLLGEPQANERFCLKKQEVSDLWNT